MPFKFFSPISRANDVFTRLFHHKLKYQSSNNLWLANIMAAAQYSSRASRNVSEAQFAKSLIEDEAELSDWSSELKSDSFKKLRLYSDSDDGDNDWRAGRGSDFKRKRESDFNGHNRGSFDRDSRCKQRSDGEFVSRRENGIKNRRFGGKSERRNDRFSRDLNVNRGSIRISDEDDDGYVSKRGVKNMSRQSIMISDEDEDVDENDDGYVSKRGVKNMSRRSIMISHEEEDEDKDEDEDDDDDDDDDDDADDVSLSKSAAVNPPRISPDGSESYLSETSFDQCAVSPLSLKAIKDAGYEKMTVVQEATIPVILKGKDVLAKARTGTGKTVAFLLPSIEVVVKSPAVSRDEMRPPFRVLVICPTPDLASQAAMEANKLIKYHPSIGVQVIMGGTLFRQEQKRMQASPCQILVATPRRFRDHMENTPGFIIRLRGIKVLVLDEADHLLDMRFRKDVEKVIEAVPKQRQTLLFSAMVPPEVRQICYIALRRDHEYVNTLREGSVETNTQVQQTHLVAPLDKHFSLLYTLLKDHIADDVDYKVLVFCTTAMVARLVADLLAELKLNVREIHSRKPQSYRTRISDEFRNSKGLILVTSDVSARGVDYPDVTLVIQVGIPADKAQYIHRLGRTGRKGKEGQGILLLAPWEEFFLSTIKDLPISKHDSPLVDPVTKKKVEKALCYVEMHKKKAAHQEWLKYYNSNKTIGKDKYRLVELANEFSRTMGLDNPPTIPKFVIAKMGLNYVPGLRSKRFPRLGFM